MAMASSYFTHNILRKVNFSSSCIFTKKIYDVSTEKFEPLSDVHSDNFLDLSGANGRRRSIRFKNGTKFLRNDIDLLPKSGQLLTAAEIGN